MYDCIQVKHAHRLTDTFLVSLALLRSIIIYLSAGGMVVKFCQSGRLTEPVTLR